MFGFKVKFRDPRPEPPGLAEYNMMVLGELGKLSNRIAALETRLTEDAKRYKDLRAQVETVEHRLMELRVVRKNTGGW